jgi:hypothetical protein
LGDLHRAVGGETELAHRFLLHRGGRERRRRRAQLALALDVLHARRTLAMLVEEAPDLGLALGVANRELVQLLTLEVGELGGEGKPVLHAVEMDRPVFLRLEALDLELALDDEAQRRALHPAGRQAPADLLPQ